MTGCSSWWEEKSDPAFTVRTPGNGAQTNAVITAANSPVGRIASVNKPGNFAVINFPIGQVPAEGTRLSIFRAGQKVGEVRMSRETGDTFRVGDIVSGAAQDGDEVRAE